MDEAVGLPRPDERFSALYAEHADRLVAYCRRKVGPAEAEEIAHEAFLRAWASWDTYSPSRPFYPWLVTIARRVCIDRGRRQQTAAAMAHKTVSIFDGIPVTRPEEFFETTEEYGWARTAVAALRPDQRRILTRQAIDGWTYSEIAKAEGISEEAVRGVLRRARDRVRTLYTDLAGSAPVALPIAALRWARRRVATSTPFDFNMMRAGEVAFAAAAAIAIGAGPTAAAPSSPAVQVRSATAAPATAAAVPAPSAPHPSHAAASSKPVGAPTTAHVAAPPATVPGRPTKVKLAELSVPDDELARRCAAADIRFRAGDHGACINTKGAVQSAQVIVETGSVEP